MQELINGTGLLLVYFLIMAGTALVCRGTIRIPDELFRKILHCILLGSFMIFVFGFQTWWLSALVAVGFVVVVYPILMFFERFRAYSKITTERRKGELKSSLIYAFLMFAFIIAICWGWLNDRYLALASIYAWGFGDAAAALVGKRFGRHKIKWKFVDGKKSVEGSAAMFVTSLVSVAIILVCRGGLNTAGQIIIPVAVAFVSTLVELYSKNGMDTLFCPISAMVTLIPLVSVFGGFA